MGYAVYRICTCNTRTGVEFLDEVAVLVRAVLHVPLPVLENLLLLLHLACLRGRGYWVGVTVLACEHHSHPFPGMHYACVFTGASL